MDPRIVRTRQQLQRALLDLAAERAFDEITVSEIAERAGVNRSSFYQHYGEKETLLADALDAVIEDAGLTTAAAALDRLAGPPSELVAMLRHVDQHAGLYAWALGAHGSATVTDRIRERSEQLVRQNFEASGAGPRYAGVPGEVVAAGIAGAAIGVIRAWLEGDPRAPVEVAAAWTWRMVLSATDG